MTTTDNMTAGLSPNAGEVIKALLGVKKAVGAIEKDRAAKNYSFRGIDDVINATHQAFLDHEVLVVPQRVVDYVYDTIQSSAGKPLGHVRIVIEFLAIHSSGSSLTLVGAGEAFDSGDKSTPKASSVAMRTALLQALSIPTGIEDIELGDDERGNEPTKTDDPDPAYVAIKRLQAAAKKLKVNVADQWAKEYKGENVKDVKDIDKLTETAVKWELAADA